MFAVQETPVRSESTAQRIRYRVRFAKTGLLRWISHRDLARLWERLVRRARFKLSMTEGFHPKPRIGFPSALALGVIGWQEVVELELAEELTPQDLLTRIAADDQPGLSVISVARLPAQFGKAQLQQSDYQITAVESVNEQPLRQAIEQLLGCETVSVDRKGKPLTVQVATSILDLDFRDGRLQLSLAASDRASLRPDDVLQLLGLSDWIEQGATIIRTRVHLQREFQSDDPSDVALSKESLPDHCSDTDSPRNGADEITRLKPE